MASPIPRALGALILSTAIVHQLGCKPSSGGGTGGAGGAGTSSSSAGGTGGVTSSSASVGAGGMAASSSSTGGAGGASASSSASSGAGGMAASSSASASSSSSGGGVGWNCDAGCQWLKRYGDANAQTGWDVATDASGNIIVAGVLGGTIDLGGGPLTGNVFVAKLDPQGNHLWSKGYAGGTGTPGVFVGIDASGDVIFGTQFAGTVDLGGGPINAGNGRGLVTKLNPQGSLLWTAQIGPAQSDIASLAIDPTGNILVATDDPAPAHKNFSVVKLLPDSTLAWTHAFGQADVSTPTVRADSAGNILVSGFTATGIPFANGSSICLFVGKLDPAGTALWGDSSTCSPQWVIPEGINHGIAVDAGGDVYVTADLGFLGMGSNFGFGIAGGVCSVQGPSDAGMIARINGANGKCKWMRTYPSSGGPLITLDATGNAVVAGATDLRFDKWSPNGDPLPQCTTAFPNQPLGSTRACHGFTLDPAGRLLVTGSFGTGIDFMNAQVSSAGQTDVFVVKL